MSHLRPRALAVLLAASLMPMPVSAEERDFYASISGVYASPADSDVSGDVFPGEVLSSDLTLEPGFGLLLALGYGAKVGIRGEVELGFRNTEFDKLGDAVIEGPDFRTTYKGDFPVDGEVTAISLMANGVYTFEAGRIRPFFGVGVGFVRLDGTLEAQAVPVVEDEEEFDVKFEKESQDAIAFAYQGMAGVIYPISERSEARFGYRYFATAKGKFDDVEAVYRTHNLEAGILFRF